MIKSRYKELLNNPLTNILTEEAEEGWHYCRLNQWVPHRYGDPLPWGEDCSCTPSMLNPYDYWQPIRTLQSRLEVLLKCPIRDCAGKYVYVSGSKTPAYQWQDPFQYPMHFDKILQPTEWRHIPTH